MKTYGIIALAVLALLFTTARWAEAVPVNLCADDGGTKHIVDTVPEAANIGANGYSNNTCDLVILISIVPTVDPLLITAKSVKIDGGPGAVSTPVEINNGSPPPVSEVRITAVGGNIDIDKAIIKATDKLLITCTFPGCTADVKDSVIIASSTGEFGAPGGRLEIRGRGDVDIQTSTIYGGANLLVQSQDGSVTFICKGDEGECQDPSESSKAVELCDGGGDGIIDGVAGFPCTVTFDSAAALNEVCTQVEAVACGGGAVELHILAELDIHLEGSTILGQGSFRIFSSAGRLFANNAVLTAQSFSIGIAGNGTSPSIDFSDAKLTATANLRMSAGAGCPAVSEVCINLQGAELVAKQGSRFPNLNGDSNPPYDPNVLDTDTECGGVGTGAVVNKANINITANNGNGLINACGATFN